jgi:hypothetical protein
VRRPGAAATVCVLLSLLKQGLLQLEKDHEQCEFVAYMQTQLADMKCVTADVSLPLYNNSSCYHAL